VRLYVKESRFRRAVELSRKKSLYREKRAKNFVGKNGKYIYIYRESRIIEINSCTRIRTAKTAVAATVRSRNKAEARLVIDRGEQIFGKTDG